jgi:RNA polymerase sigma factor (sigma-70 family)
MKDVDQIARAERSRMRAELMVRLQRGDRDACRALLDDIGPSVMQFLRRLEPWLFAIARNIAADHTRRHWSRASWEELVAEPPERVETPSPEAPPRLEEALASLSPTQREAFSMLKLRGLSLEAAAARAGVSVGAMKVRAHRAYKALRELIGGQSD